MLKMDQRADYSKKKNSDNLLNKILKEESVESQFAFSLSRVTNTNMTQWYNLY